MAKLINHEVVIVMIPLPAQGHLNQLLHLSRLISAYHLPLHFAGTAVHLRQAKNRIHGWNPLSISTVKFHELPIPNYETPLPNPNSTTKFPTQLMPSLHATSHLRHPITFLLQELSKNYRRVIVIYDSLMAWVLQDTPSIPNVECYSFRSISAFSIYSWDKSTVTPEFTEYCRVQFEFREIVNSGNFHGRQPSEFGFQIRTNSNKKLRLITVLSKRIGISSIVLFSVSFGEFDSENSKLF